MFYYPFIFIGVIVRRNKKIPFDQRGHILYGDQQNFMVYLCNFTHILLELIHFLQGFFFHFFFDKHCDMNYFKEQRSFLKSVDQAQENELLFSFIVKLLKFPFFYFMVALEDRELKTGICKSLNRKPSNSSFSSA